MKVEWVVTVVAEADMTPEQQQSLNELRQILTKEAENNA